nr:hypothetical protein CR513_13447 [Ipomoea batatas]
MLFFRGSGFVQSALSSSHSPMKNLQPLDSSAWTEGDQVIGAGAGESAGIIIVRVTVRLRACFLENLGILSRRACRRRVVVAGAAIFRGVEPGAGALAGDDGAGIGDLEDLGAVGIEVGDAAGVLAVAGAAGRLDAEVDVVAVDEADVVEVVSRRSHAAAGAPESAAVAGDAPAVTAGVEIAARPCPEPARPAPRKLKLSAFSGGQCEAAGSVFAGKCSGPHRMRATVVQRENAGPNIRNPCQKLTWSVIVALNFVADTVGSSAWTEGDQVIGAGAGESAGSIIVRVTVRLRARVLEDLGILRRRACRRRVMVAGATIFRGIKLGAGALAGDNGAGIGDLEGLGAVGIEIGDAAGVLAVAGAAGGVDAEVDVVAVDEADVVEILVGVPVGDEPARPPRRSLKLSAFSRGQCEAALAEKGSAVAGKCSGPDRVRAAVVQRETAGGNIRNSCQKQTLDGSDY